MNSLWSSKFWFDRIDEKSRIKSYTNIKYHSSGKISMLYILTF